MKKFVPVLLIVLMLPGCQKAVKSSFDFSGLDEFWNVYEQLSQDVMPPDEDWDRLFNTPGYAALTAEEFTHDYFKRYFSLAYMPSKKAELEEELRKTGWNIQYLDHMTHIPENREKINEHREWLETGSNMMGDVLRLASEYLEDGTIDYDEPIPIAFVIFGNDARGYSPITIDMMYSIEQGEALTYLVAHEAHHFYRNKVLKFREPDGRTFADEAMWVVDQLHGEGVADQINRRPKYIDKKFPANTRSDEMFIKYYNDSEGIIGRLDIMLKAAYGTKPEERERYGRLRRVVPMSGHPTGFYMANVIREELGKEAVYEDIGDPFAFFERYNEAASRKPGAYPVFSEASLRFIAELKAQFGTE